MESSVLVKAFRLIEILGQEHGRCSLASLAERSGLPKPTTHRILNQLAAIGYVERIETGYVLSAKLARVATGTDNALLLQAAEPFLKQLHDRTCETVNLGVLKRDRVVYLRVLESTHQLRRIGEPNSTDPFHCTALGRAIAANLEPVELRALVARAIFERRTNYTIDTDEKLFAEIDKVKAKGFALEENETDVGVLCIGAAILLKNKPVGAISISLPTARANHAGIDNLTTLIRSTAADISMRLLQLTVTKPNL